MARGEEQSDAAESLGVVVFNSKMGAAAVSAFLTAVGGAFTRNSSPTSIQKA